MDNSVLLGLCGGLALVAFASLRKAFHDPRLEEIPIVGYPWFFFGYWDALKFLVNATDFIQQGYDRYPEGIFRVSRLWGWEFVVCGPKLIKEVGSVPENVLSFYAGLDEEVQARFTLGSALAENPYHQRAMRSLTKNLPECLPDVRDEIICAFNDGLQLKGSDWTSFPVLPTTMTIIARVSNRLFVGLPLCRDKAYLENNIQYTVAVVISGTLINLFPPFLQPLVGPIISTKNRSNTRALKFLGALIEERLSKEKELGPNWPGKTNDLISWLLDFAEGEERTVPALLVRVMSVNMAAIHTSSMTFTHALFDLTTHPEYLLPMREEAERIVKEEGWTKAALNNMVKIDSFLRESQRMHCVGPVMMTRKVVSKDGFTFSDGTFLPQGALLSVAVRPTHYDASNYQNAAEFDGFRFERELAELSSNSDPSKDSFQRHMISTAVGHLPFGTGKHACPGRFFAAAELKAMLAHFLIEYDIKAEVDGVRPPDSNFGRKTIPNTKGKVLFRRRQ
ncbi:cytochrome P450 [Mycena capillaripes]|nr:cytochrome P450 [Mycena capillaripes]